MGDEQKYMDLLYFGYDYSKESGQNREYEREFINGVKKKFPNVQLEDAYDSIKGFRQKVYIDEKDKDDYFSWLIGNQWYECSMMMQFLMMKADKEKEQMERFEKYFALAKKQYPEAFKEEFRNAE